MNRYKYYEELKTLARDIRVKHQIDTFRLQKSKLRQLYKFYGIKRIDLWPLKGVSRKLKLLRGAYFNDPDEPSVMIARHLPYDPAVFTMAHELKHHLKDRDLALSYCDTSNEREPIEIGAEIFAAELIFPDQDFIDQMHQRGVYTGQCTPEDIVRLKHETQTTLSYAGLVKKADFLKFSPAGSLEKVSWKKLEEQIYGEPIYKQILRSRKSR